MRARIHVVQDFPDILRMVMQAVNAAGHKGDPANGGEDALRKVQTRAFDLVVTDLSIPKMSGVGLIESIRRKAATRQLPVSAVTVRVCDGTAQSARQVGCDGFIPKPFGAKHLAQQIAKNLGPSRA